MTDGALSSLMPFWVRHLPVLLAVPPLPSTSRVTARALRVSRPREPVPAEPWHARARALWPQQVVAQQAQLLLPLALVALLPLVRGPVTATPAVLVVALALPLSMLGTGLAGQSFRTSAGIQRPAGVQLR